MIKSFEKWAGTLQEYDDPGQWCEHLGLWAIAWEASENSFKDKLKGAFNFYEPDLRAELCTIIDNLSRE